MPVTNFKHFDDMASLPTRRLHSARFAPVFDHVLLPTYDEVTEKRKEYETKCVELVKKSAFSSAIATTPTTNASPSPNTSPSAQSEFSGRLHSRVAPISTVAAGSNNKGKKSTPKARERSSSEEEYDDQSQESSSESDDDEVVVRSKAKSKANVKAKDKAKGKAKSKDKKKETLKKS
jgi:hypothetical protein